MSISNGKLSLVSPSSKDLSSHKKSKKSSKPKKKRIRIIYFDTDSSSTSSERNCEPTMPLDDSRDTTSDLGGMESESDYSSDDHWSCSENGSSKSKSRSKQQKKSSKSQTKMKTKSDRNGRRGDRKRILSESEEFVEEYVVEKIVDMEYRPEEGKKYYWVKWLNYDSAENTWEPEEHMEKCKDLLEEFQKQSGKSDGKKRSRSNSKPSKPKKRKSSEQVSKVPQNGVISNGTRNHIESSESDDHIHNDRDLIKNWEASVKTGMDASSQNGVLSNGTRNHIESSESDDHNHNDRDLIKNWEASVIKVVDTSSPSRPVKKNDMIWLDEMLNPGTTPAGIVRVGNLFYFRVIMGSRIDWIYIDLTEPLYKANEVYKCLVTEDLTEKEPKLICGVTTSVSGEKFCLVQFEGHSYVEIVPPENFFAKFPTFRKYFEINWPNFFAGKP